MFWRIQIPLAGRSPDTIYERLAGFDVEGIEELADSLHVYFGSREQAAEASAALAGSQPEEMEDRNWSAEWQAEWEPIEIGQRFFLCPAWIAAETPVGRIRLEMVPGNVFGGGDHPTTQLCLELLEGVVVPGCRVADIGAGTGILTRAARALGARTIGCDIDPASCAFVDFLGSADALPSGVFDGVIANIHFGVLRELALRRLVRDGGWLLVSGFLPEQAGEVDRLFGAPVEARERGGWCAALIRI